jgi:hypothetical protein
MYENNQQPYPVNTLPNSNLALISLIAGILGLTLFPFIASIVAVWAGYQARKETRSVPPKASGDGMATAGIIMGWIGIGLWVVGICCAAIYFIFVVGLIGADAMNF